MRAFRALAVIVALITVDATVASAQVVRGFKDSWFWGVKGGGLVYSSYAELSTQVPVGVDEGLKHDSGVHCDELVSIPKTSLTDFVGTLSPAKIGELHRALSIPLGLS